MEPDSSSAPAGPSSQSRLGRFLVAAFAIAGVVFMIVVFRESWNRTRGSVLPGWPQVAGAFVLIVIGLIAAERGWRTLVGSGREQLLARAFFTAQLGKYIPGGVWQAVGQVGLTSRAGVPAGRAMVAFPVHAVTQVAAGGVLGAVLALTATHLSGAARLATLAGLGLGVLLARGWMDRALRLARRSPGGLLPPQRAIIASSAWSVATLIASGGAFAVLAQGTDVSAGASVFIPAYALAWAVGFLALPFPSGIGVREGVLIGVLGSAAPVVAVSLIHRLLTMLSEALVILAVRAMRSSGPGPPE